MDSVLIPIQCEFYALEGVSQLISTIELVRKSLNPDLEIEGVILSMFDGRTNQSIQVVEEVKKFFGSKLYATVIRKRAAGGGAEATVCRLRCTIRGRRGDRISGVRDGVLESEEEMAKVKPGGLGRALELCSTTSIFIRRAVSVRKPEEPAGTAPSDTVGRIVHIRLDDIKPNAHQPKTQFDERSLQELAESISEHGVIQPVLVRPAKNGYDSSPVNGATAPPGAQGLRKFRLSSANWTTGATMLFALIENMQREDLNGMEEARGLQEMQEAYGLTQEQVAKTVGKSGRTWPMRSACSSCRLLFRRWSRTSLSAGHARTIAGFDGERRQIGVAGQAVRYGWSVGRSACPSRW